MADFPTDGKYHEDPPAEKAPLKWEEYSSPEETAAAGVKPPPKAKEEEPLPKAVQIGKPAARPKAAENKPRIPPPAPGREPARARAARPAAPAAAKPPTFPAPTNPALGVLADAARMRERKPDPPANHVRQAPPASGGERKGPLFPPAAGGNQPSRPRPGPKPNEMPRGFVNPMHGLSTEKREMPRGFVNPMHGLTPDPAKTPPPPLTARPGHRGRNQPAAQAKAETRFQGGKQMGLSESLADATGKPGTGRTDVPVPSVTRTTVPKTGKPNQNTTQTPRVEPPSQNQATGQLARKHDRPLQPPRANLARKHELPTPTPPTPVEGPPAGSSRPASPPSSSEDAPFASQGSAAPPSPVSSARSRPMPPQAAASPTREKKEASGKDVGRSRLTPERMEIRGTLTLVDRNGGRIGQAQLNGST